MIFTESELEYMQAQGVGRLATAQKTGTLQVNPVGFRYNAELATIDITGFDMAASQKFRNVTGNGRAAFVVDDIVSKDPWRIRCVEIRGTAEALRGSGSTGAEGDGPVIRIHPERIISFGIDEPDTDPHLLTSSNRNVG